MKSNMGKDMAHKNKTSKRVKKSEEVAEVVAQGQKARGREAFPATVASHGGGKKARGRWAG